MTKNNVYIFVASGLFTAFAIITILYADDWTGWMLAVLSSWIGGFIGSFFVASMINANRGK